MKTVALLSISIYGVAAFGSSSSGFTQRLALPMPTSVRQMSGNMVMYEVNNDPPSSNGDQTNIWSVLAKTESWLTSVLGNADAANPYTRKEVTYLCEPSEEDALVVAGLWRRLRESRELGQSHGELQEQMLKGKDPDQIPNTLRQTQVLVLPNDSHLDNFHTFDAIVTKINQCRRNARDFIMDVNIMKNPEEQGKIGQRDWSVSVNFAHLHPNYGEKTKEQMLQELKEEEEKGEVDVNLETYKEKRLLARRSPYPTVCIEVRATPPPDFGRGGAPPSASQGGSFSSIDGDKITSEDVKKLELLFGRTASFEKEKPKKSDDNFYSSIADVKGIEEISLLSPLESAQEWIANNHESFDIKTSMFTNTKCQQVDEGYEFVFNNIAMKQASMVPTKNTSQYLVFEKFMSTSSTSFERFSGEVNELISLLPSIRGKVQASILHPEHVDVENRSPVPVLVMMWA